MGIMEGANHTISVSYLNAIKKMTTTLPKHVHDKIALEILKDRMSEAAIAGEGQVVHLTLTEGGLAVPIIVNCKSATSSPQPSFPTKR